MMLPPFFRTFFANRKPAPPRCTDENVKELLGRIISHENNSDDQAERFYRAQGEEQ